MADKYERIAHTGWKDLDRAGKIQYIKDYYTLPIILGIVVLIFVVWAVVYFGFTSQKPALYVMTVNVSAPAEKEAELEKELAAYLELGKRENVVWDDTTAAGGEEYNLFLKLTTLLGAHVLDALVFSDGDKEMLENLGAFSTLQEALGDDALSRLEAAGRVVEGLSPDLGDGEARYPCAMAVDLTGSKAAADWGLTPLNGEHIYLAISVTPEHPEAAAALIDYLLAPELAQ